MDAASSTLTSAQDPQSQRSRVFLGNLNTAQMTRTELEQRFSRYGQVSGVSVHKGFGFVQFFDEWAARAAVEEEDGQVYYGMRVDANIASEPKVRRAGGSGGSLGVVGQPALKRARQDLPLGSGAGGVGVLQPFSGPRKQSNLVSLVTPSNPVPEAQPEKRPTINDPTVKDLLVCGNCKEILPNLDGLMAHKTAGCRLRLVCRCLQTGEPVSMDCAECGAAFASAWELLTHCRDEHDVLLFASSTAGAAAPATPAASGPPATSASLSPAAPAAPAASASAATVKPEPNGQ